MIGLIPGTVLDKIINWSSRIAATLFVLFLALFSLDVFTEYQGWAVWPAFLTHLLIPAVLLAAVVLAWRWELIGAAVFLALAAWYVWTVGLGRPWSWYAAIPGPAIAVAILFLLGWFQKRGIRRRV